MVLWDLIRGLSNPGFVATSCQRMLVAEKPLTVLRSYRTKPLFSTEGIVLNRYGRWFGCEICMTVAVHQGSCGEADAAHYVSEKSLTRFGTAGQERLD